MGRGDGLESIEPEGSDIDARGGERVCPRGCTHVKDGALHTQMTLWITLWRDCEKRRTGCAQPLWTTWDQMWKLSTQDASDLVFFSPQDVGENSA